MSYPVQLSIVRPGLYDRKQVLLRLLVGIGLGWLGLTSGTLLSMFYVFLPIIVGITISARSSAYYKTELAPKLWRGFEWLFAFSAYMLFATDRFPLDHGGNVRTEIRITSNPTLGSALLRFVTSLPSAVVLGLLGCVSGVFALFAMLTILIDRKVPAGILAFQEGVLRWQARLAAYHASLVDEYPPFSFEHDEIPQAMVRERLHT